MRTVRLSDFLSAETLEKVAKVMNEIHAGKLDISKGQREILSLIEPERAALLDKYVLAEYLAYYLAAAASQPGKNLSFLPVDN